MEIPISLLMYVSITIFFISAFIFFKLTTRPESKSAKLPPGPWKLPLIGNMHNLIGSVPHRALHQLAMKYGQLMHLQVGEVSAVVVSSPEAAKEVMKTHDINFASRPPILAAEIMSYNCTSITFGPYGDYWRQLRKICILELLSLKRVQSFRSLREEVFTDLARWVAAMEGSAVNLTEKLYSSMYAITATAALGKINKEREILVPIIKEVLQLAGGFDIAEIYPSNHFLRAISPTRRRLSKLHREADKIFDEIIHEHKQARSDKQEDLVDILLKYQDGGTGDEFRLTDNNIKSVIMDILGAGSETSATTIDWAMAEMLKNPRVLAKAQEEVRRVYKEKGHVDESCIAELVYLKAVVKESLRMHPPLPLLLPRKSGDTCQINGHLIPANAKIIVNAWAINRDPRHWKDGHVFDPERFVDSHVDFRGNHFEFIPFGAGRRICAGISFGLANVELPLAMLLYHFDWKLPAGQKPADMDMADGFGASARRVHPLCVVPFFKIPLPLPTK